jgi:hypothetical protein
MTDYETIFLHTLLRAHRLSFSIILFFSLAFLWLGKVRHIVWKAEATKLGLPSYCFC